MIVTRIENTSDTTKLILSDFDVSFYQRKQMLYTNKRKAFK
ncbi:hypothetical protein [Flavobacterium branchiicola]|uniref:Uncharacterized protein n=1 Tax=Flavobacterium branchiicola TaxID=1114875 RepID=A0ABV9PH39_9FLAO|nr:hypothetical protein [Flavobacterium branchiicola]